MAVLVRSSICYNKSMIKTRQKLIRLCVLVALILLVASGIVWWTKVYTSPQNIFWGALDSNLTTSSVTRQVVDNNSNGQTVQMQMGSRNIAHTVSALSDNQGNTVKSETLVTPSTSYFRITDYQRVGSSISSRDKAKIIGVWAKDNGSGDSKVTVSNNFSTSFAPKLPSLPIANLSSQDRRQLVNYAKVNKVFIVDFSKSELTRKNDRTQRVYTVKFNVEKFIQFLKLLGQKTGLNDYEGVDTSQYKGLASPVMKVTIDESSRHVVSVKDVQGGLEETYSSYDVPVAASLPSQPITANELDQRLKEVTKP